MRLHTGVMLISAFASACGNAGLDANDDETQGPATGTTEQEIREHQGREHQGREHQGTDATGSELRAWDLKSFRKNFANEPSIAPRDKVEVVQGQLVMSRSLAFGTTPSLSACSSSGYGEARACGWVVDAVGSCSPGTMVSIGGSGSCGGACTGDTMLRICSGSAPCEYPGLAHNDDCGGLCSFTSFTCPSSGTYTAMTASYSSAAVTVPSLAANGSVYPYFNIVHQGAELQYGSIDALTYTGARVPGLIAGVTGQDPFVSTPSGHVVGTTLRYNMQVWNAAQNHYDSICQGEAVDDDGQAVALVVRGYWPTDGSHVDDPTQATFACKRGVVNKCYRWGYRPWDNFWSGQTYVLGERYHQTCTRAARADYCGDGRSFTMNGTEIDVFDLLAPPIQARDPSATVGQNPMSFEAAWNADGATCLSHVRWSNAPIDVFYSSCRAPHDQFGAQRICDSVAAALDGGTPGGGPFPTPQIFDESRINDGGLFYLDGGP